MNNYDVAKHAGEVLRRLIEERGYSSQEDFAYDFGTTPRTVSRYINDGINKLNVLQELAEFFQVDLFIFLRDE